MKKIILISFLLFLVLILGITTGGYLALIKGIPGIEEIRNYQPFDGTKVYADDDTFIGEFKIEKGVYTSIDKMPDHLIKAVVAVEDARFWMHKGIDYFAISRAVVKDIRAKGIKEGGSTITQQLVKVVFLTPEKTIIRKLKEAALAFRIERNLTKEEILELYLNRVYFGHGAYGVEMASRTYFSKSVSDIDLAEASLLGGLVKAPNRYSPYNNLDRSKHRQSIVLKRMRDEGYITREQSDEAYQKPLYLSSLRYGQEAANYFLEYIRKDLEEKYGMETVYKGGLKVYTTLNRKMQIAAVTSLKKGLRRIDKRQGFRGILSHRDIDVEEELSKKEPFKKVIMKPGDLLTGMVLRVTASEATVKTRGVIGRLSASDAKWVKKLINDRGDVIKEFKNFKLTDILKPGDIIHLRVKDVFGNEPVFKLEQEPIVQAAVVAMEPATGYIRALVGGYNFGKSEFNRAVYAKRQVGSAFKPIIYAAAIDRGFTTASIIVDEPVSYPSGVFGDWEPSNYDEKFHGATRLREGLQHSRNIVTIKLLEEIGIEETIKFAKRLGFREPLPHNLTLALGSLSATPLEMTSAFCIFAREGVRMKPIAVKYIIDLKGNIIENNRPQGVEAISPQTAYLATSMLEDVVKKGTGWRAKALKRPVAGKTGTTNDYIDAWFIGFTPELAASVWVGFDNQRQLGNKETGSRAAAPIWVSFMRGALKASASFEKEEREKEEIKQFLIPEGITAAIIDPLTGLLATEDSEKVVDYFKEGSVPIEYSTKFYRDLIKKQKKELLKIKKPETD